MLSGSQLKQAVLDELAWEPSWTRRRRRYRDAGVITLTGHDELRTQAGGKKLRAG